MLNSPVYQKIMKDFPQNEEKSVTNITPINIDSSSASKLADLNNSSMPSFSIPIAQNSNMSSLAIKPKEIDKPMSTDVDNHDSKINKALLSIVDKDLISRYNLKINSGYRDPSKNAKVGGAKNSQHIHGNAYDLDVRHLNINQRRELIKELQQRGIGGLGIGYNSIHADVGKKRHWTYDKSGKWMSGMMKGYEDLFN